MHAAFPQPRGLDSLFVSFCFFCCQRSVRPVDCLARYGRDARRSSGARSEPRTTTGVVSGVGVVDGVLYLIGTGGDDEVSIAAQAGGRLKIHADFLPHGENLTLDASSVDLIIAHLGAGDDELAIAGNVGIPAIVDGGEGNDELTGGGGRTILIGGLGRDRLAGGKEGNVLIGGAVGNDDATLVAALNAWTSDLDYGSRAASVGALLTILDDNAKDVLTGAAGQDLIFSGVSDRVTSAGKHAEEAPHDADEHPIAGRRDSGVRRRSD